MKGRYHILSFLATSPLLLQRPLYFLKGNGTPEQFRQIHETVIKTSPNYFNVSRLIRLDADLVVEK